MSQFMDFIAICFPFDFNIITSMILKGLIRSTQVKAFEIYIYH